MKATKKDMKSEALERMKLLGLDGKIIEDFETNSRVSVSSQKFIKKDPNCDDDSEDFREYEPDSPYICCKGLVHSLETVSLDDERFQSEECLLLIEEIELLFHVLVYHVHRREDADDMIQYALLYIGEDSGEWESARQKTADGMPSVYVTTDDPNYGIKCAGIFTKPVLGRLFRITGFTL